MWFKKKKKVNGITLSEWIKDHVDDKRKYLKLYIGKGGTFKILDTFYSIKDISYGLVEKYKDSFVDTVELVDSNNEHDATLVFIEE
jgi:hypothetical protein